MGEGLYSDFTTDQLRELRKLTLEKRAKGVLSFSYNGQSFTYASPAQMLVVAQGYSREIVRRMAAEKGWVPASSVVGGFSTFRPLSGGNQ